MYIFHINLSFRSYSVLNIMYITFHYFVTISIHFSMHKQMIRLPPWRSIILGYTTFLFISTYSTSAFSLHNAYLVRTVIDYVTVYRAHSSHSIRKKGVTPLSVPSPLYGPLLHLLQAGNSVTGPEISATSAIRF